MDCILEFNRSNWNYRIISFKLLKDLSNIFFPLTAFGSISDGARGYSIPCNSLLLGPPAKYSNGVEIISNSSKLKDVANLKPGIDEDIYGCALRHGANCQPDCAQLTTLMQHKLYVFGTGHHNQLGADFAFNKYRCTAVDHAAMVNVLRELV